ncbi:MAG: serine acetyltransferase [Negativicutes bacterium]|nr:serine acetyltransferase [Negativicutes bacterium]
MKHLFVYRIGHWAHKRKLRMLARICDIINYFIHNSYIPSSCEIGENTKLAYHGIGVVIHSRAVIGANCIIGQGITIGRKGGGYGVPVIEDNVYIGPGVRILGDIKIGHHSVIGANAVVLQDIDSYSIVAGIPAKVIDRITNETYNQKYKEYIG